jgi:hypothetical protein
MALRNRFVVSLAISACAALLACDKPEATPAAARPAAEAPAATAVPPAPSPVAPQAASGNMAHCPSTVAGSSTVVDDAPTGVALTVTAKDPAAVQEIRSRAVFLVSASKNTTAPITHNGTGEGGGVFGRCPVVMRNTKLEASTVEGGAKLIVTPSDAREQDWLRRESRSRLAELSAPGAAGSGMGKMAHCPNAVKGAATTIADGSDAVAITVTAKSDDAVKEIRDRARLIVAAAAKSDGTPIKHDGTGDGHGGYGRCPIVLKDTAVAEKDAPGGAIITVKPKDAKNLPALEQQVRDRTARFF